MGRPPRTHRQRAVEACRHRPGEPRPLTLGPRRFDFSQLSVEERIQLVADICESLVHEDPAVADYSAEELAEIDRRIAEHERDPTSAIPWEDVRAGLARILERGA